MGAQTQSVGSGNPAGETAEQEIQQLLNAQVAAWNHGNLEGFMSLYWNSPELTFFSTTSQTNGWTPTLERYREHYQTGGRAMGKLDFPALEVTMLSPDAAFVRGKFHLKMPDEKEHRGVFTLVMRRLPGEGWKIVHDHSSGE
jgi:beta-aspartyl-peptidase (threonine type)